MEIWKTIEWWERYEVSSLWNIRCTSFRKSKNTCMMKQKVSWDWYAKVWLSIFWKQKLVSVHRIVAKHFIDNLYNKDQVNHKDGNKLNNCIDNLEWCTSSENIRHRIDVLKQPCSFNFLKIDQLTLDWTFIRTWDSLTDAKNELWFRWIAMLSMAISGKRKTAYWYKWRLASTI